MATLIESGPTVIMGSTVPVTFTFAYDDNRVPYVVEAIPVAGRVSATPPDVLHVAEYDFTEGAAVGTGTARMYVQGDKDSSRTVVVQSPEKTYQTIDEGDRYSVVIPAEDVAQLEGVVVLTASDGTTSSTTSVDIGGGAAVVDKPLIVTVEQDGGGLRVEWSHGADTAALYDVHLSTNAQPTNDATVGNNIGDTVSIGNVSEHTFAALPVGAYRVYGRIRYSADWAIETGATVVADGRYVDFNIDVSIAAVPVTGLTAFAMPVSAAALTQAVLAPIVSPLNVVFTQKTETNLSIVDSAWRVKLEPTSKGSTHVQFGMDVPPNRVYTLRQQVRVETGFDYGGTNNGGKIGFGLFAGRYASGGHVFADGVSVRIMWRANSNGSNKRLVAYLYKHDSHQYGDDVTILSGLAENRYYDVVIVLALNTSGGASDGFLKVVVDGVVTVNQTGMKWWTQQYNGANVVVNRLDMTNFHGGADTSWAPSKTVYLGVRNVQYAIGDKS